jgi:lysophospholipase L1-like esterase
LTSVLPHDGFKWNRSVQNVVQKVDELNAQIQAYAAEKKIPYVDYNTEMRTEKGGMKAELSHDGVHPYPDTYLLMEAMVKPVIDKQLKKKK